MKDYFNFGGLINFGSHNTQLVITAIVASLVTAGAVLALQPSRTSDEEWDSSTSKGGYRPITRELSPLGIEVKQGELAQNDSEVLINEQLARNRVFLGEEGMEKLRKAKIVVVGAGGVGSWAAVMLARSGVFNLRVIDFDQVTLSSLNRHAAATRADVGIPKVSAIKRYIKMFAPSCKVDARNEMFNAVSAASLLEGQPDLVLDCIDNINTKIDLLKYCHDNNLKVVSSMGAGAKADPTRIQMADISETLEDPLARSVRRLLRQKGINSGIPVVYSTEKPGSVKLLPLDESKAEDAKDFAILPEFRSRILPVLGTLPAMFGMTMASYTICSIAGHHLEPLAIKQRDGVYYRLNRDLANFEKNIYNCHEIPPFDNDDVGFLVEEVWRGRSAISGQMDKLRLIRFDPTQPLGFTNCVLVTKGEAVKHHEMFKSGVNPAELYSPQILDYINNRFQLSKELCKQRDLPTHLIP